MKLAHFVILALFLALLLQLFVVVYGFGFAEDAYIHAEIVKVVANNFFHPTSYEPLASVKLTYPPFFHYLSMIPFLFVHDFVLAVNIMGSLAALAFPLVMFLAGSVFGSRVAAFSALFSVIIATFAHVSFFGEFPEVLAMDLLPLFFYFYMRKRYYVSGISLGLTFLSHSFVGPFAYFTAAFLLAIDFVKKNFSAFKLLLPAAFLSFLWLPQYLLIVVNAAFGRWHNTINYSAYPGFVPLAILSEYVNKLNQPLLLLSLIGIFLSFKEVFKAVIEKRFSTPSPYLALAFLFLTTSAFTIYHFPPFQLKMLDLFTIPVVLGAAVAVDRALLILPLHKHSFLAAASVVLAVFVVISFIFGPFKAMSDYKEGKQYHLPGEVRQASDFLKDYDSGESRLVVVDEYRKYGKSELIVSRLSGKLPLEAAISDLEHYSPEYQQRLADRQKVIEAFKSEGTSTAFTDVMRLLQKHGVRYVFARNCVLGKIVFENALVRVCQI
ncbi:hypothetical protein HYV85_03780 [Candidatus Woesearchaeota archaeon]|nr:hypothetical protein [Candidatus Woesearchaeota archaeon]